MDDKTRNEGVSIHFEWIEVSVLKRWAEEKCKQAESEGVKGGVVFDIRYKLPAIPVASESGEPK